MLESKLRIVCARDVSISVLSKCDHSFWISNCLLCEAFEVKPVECQLIQRL